jgi:hypothetical protein
MASWISAWRKRKKGLGYSADFGQQARLAQLRDRPRQRAAHVAHSLKCRPRELGTKHRGGG